MPKPLDLVGTKFTRLLVVGLSPIKKKERRWDCVCDCGNKLAVRTGALRSGNTKSCGCIKIEALQSRNITHGLSHLPEYETWKGMKSRCYNPNDDRFENYNSKGIVVCDKWLNDFTKFLEDIGRKPDDSQTWTIGRVDNDLGYFPENVRWESLTEQSRNHSLQKNNTSGIVGVRLNSKEINGRIYESWVASWNDEHGKKCTKEFSTNKYGEIEAKQMAIDCRNKMLEELRKKGINYMDSHGSDFKVKQHE